MYGLAIVLIVLMMLFIGRICSKHWVNPAFVMILYWSVYIIAALWFFRGDFNWTYLGLLWILAACIFFAFGNALGSALGRRAFLTKIKINNNPHIEKNFSNLSWKFILLCIIIGLFRTSMEVVLNGFSFRMFLDLESLIEMNTAMAYQRYYGGGATYGSILQILLIFVYAGPLCGGYAFVYSKKQSERLLCFATFIPIISNLLFTNTKAGVIASVFLWISSFIVGYIEKNKKAPSIKLTRAFKVGMAVVGTFGLLYISMLLRIGDLNSQTMDIVNRKFLVYALGQMPAFDYWFGNNNYNLDYSLGEYTFIGLFNAMGLSVRRQGLYTDVLLLSNGMYTNVFTAFRGIIQDYGIIGGLIFYMIFGVSAGYFFQCALIGKRRNVIARVVLVSSYFFILHSLFSSAWTYVSYILAFVVFAFYLWITGKNVGVSTKEKPCQF
jgi:oligosaccharide repeat unit polymerase